MIKVDLIYNQLQKNIKKRDEVDKPLINWFILTFILSWLTFSIALIYIFIKRILRVDKYIIRKHEFFNILIDFIEIKSKENNLEKQYMFILRDKLNNFGLEVKPIMLFVKKTFTPFIKTSFIIIIVLLLIDLSHLSTKSIIIFSIILIIWILYIVAGFLKYIYKMNKVWDDIKQYESEMYNIISEVLISLKLIDKPISYYSDKHLKKDFVLYTILGFATCGIWFLVWDYYIHIAPDKMYNIFHNAEDTMVEVVQSCCIRD